MKMEKKKKKKKHFFIKRHNFHKKICFSIEK